MAELKTTKDWMIDLPTTDEEALEFLYYDKNPQTFAVMGDLYKLYREHYGMDILEACKKTLKAYLGETNG